MEQRASALQQRLEARRNMFLKSDGNQTYGANRPQGKIHTILKVKFLSKNSILTKPQHFHEIFTQNFFDNFSREIKVVNS